MTDRELLELAAKSAQYVLDSHTQCNWKVCLGGVEWNPLDDDGDALRLQVKLHMDIQVSENGRSVWAGNAWGSASSSVEDDDWLAATRQAIVGAAAEMATTTTDQRTVDIPL
jgi:hypothetical protein